MSTLLNLHRKLAYILYFKAIKKAIRILDKIKKYFCALFFSSARASVASCAKRRELK
jgi:hypothetical protein